MAYSFRPARRSEAKPLIGLYAESGCGKTWSALMLARGFVGPTGKIGMIETESGRGEAYADILPGGYSVLPLRENFSPKDYGAAIDTAEEAKLDALIIDSASHEWSGKGGVLAMAVENQAKHGKSILTWQQPKMDHQRFFMLRLMQTPIPLVVVCMRAKYPMMEVQQGGKKEWVRSTVLEPVQADDILFEMFVHGWIDREHRLHVTKYTRDDLRTVLPDGKPITIDSGRALAAWARGTDPTAGPQHAVPSVGDGAGVDHATPSPAPAPDLSDDSLIDEARARAIQGSVEYQAFWSGLDRKTRQRLVDEGHHETLKTAAAYADKKAGAHV
jgi:hypothetical protein